MPACLGLPEAAASRQGITWCRNLDLYKTVSKHKYIYKKVRIADGRMEIPGYKWDRERKRYFKVLKTGELPNSNYTVSALASKDRRSKRSLVRQENEQNGDAERVVHNRTVRRLGSRSSVWYSGGATEIISSFIATHDGLLTGARDGTLAFGSWKSETGRSIVDLCMLHDTPVVAVVDHDAGSLVGCGPQSTHLKGQFVTQLQPIGQGSDAAVAIGSQRGLNVWRPAAASMDIIKSGSVSALAPGDGPVIASGYGDGTIKLVDVRSRSATAAGSLGKNRRVTHVASLASRSALIAAGLEDQMMLFDTRKAVEPVLEFTGYENWSTSAHGFALSREGDAVAVANDSDVVQVFDVNSGRLVKTLLQRNKLSGPRPRKVREFGVTCLRWPETGLFMAVGNTVRAFPSVLPRRHAEPTPEQAQALAATHSNINLHEKT